MSRHSRKALGDNACEIHYWHDEQRPVGAHRVSGFPIPCYLWEWGDDYFSPPARITGRFWVNNTTRLKEVLPL